MSVKLKVFASLKHKPVHTVLLKTKKNTKNKKNVIKSEVLGLIIFAVFLFCVLICSFSHFFFQDTNYAYNKEVGSYEGKADGTGL